MEFANQDSEWNQTVEVAERAEREEKKKELQKTAALMIICVTNAKVADVRRKTMGFQTWKEAIIRKEVHALKVKLAHYNQEVEAIKQQETLLRTNFAQSKNALEQKLGLLVAKVVQMAESAAPP